ncbi:MAG TPA: nucleoside deaminase [Bacteroidales bacterium]|nr:nucleoside deaminase [Bacteroidales bacterium]
MNHEQYMRMALLEAQKAMEKDEVPIGAVIVCHNKIIARGHNQTEMLKDVTAHAEIIAITAASNYLGAKYLTDCTIYVTLEPCVMCAGALSWAQISNVVFGAYDEKHGFTNTDPRILHPKTTLTGGVLAEECGELLKDFFGKKRK